MAGYVYNPEAFITPATDPSEWSRQQVEQINRTTDGYRQTQRDREQSRQFDAQEQRLADNAAMEHDEFGQRMALDQRSANLAESQHVFAMDRFAAEQNLKLDDLEREGMAIANEALVKAGSREELEAIQKSAAEMHGLIMEPAPAQQQQPAAPGQEMPPPPGSELDPTGPFDPERQRGEQKMLDGLPPGGGTSAEGRDASKQITAGITGALEARGIPPNELGAAPVPSLEESFKRFSEAPPLTALDSGIRTKVDADMLASYQKRAAALAAMNLPPDQMAVAMNLNARAHGIPEAPLPPPPSEIPQNPYAPPEEQLPMETTLSEQVANLAMAAPEMPPDIARDGQMSGGYIFRSKRTGKVVGQSNWDQVQADRRTVREAEVAPILDMVDDPRDKQLLEGAAKSYIENGSKEGFDLVRAFVTGRLRAESNQLRADGLELTAQTQSRLAGSEELKIDQAVSKQVTDVVVGNFDKLHNIKGSKETLALANGALAKLGKVGPDGSTTADAMTQRSVFSDVLAMAATRRATDKDAERFLGNSFEAEAQELQSYLLGDGKLAAQRIVQMRNLMVRVKAYEAFRAKKLEKELRNAVRDDFIVRKYGGTNLQGFQDQAARILFAADGGSDSEVEHVISGVPAARAQARERATGSSVSVKTTTTTPTISPDEDL